MAVTYKVLGQVKPSAATDTTLYTVPTGSGNYAVVSTLTACNLSASTDTIRIAIRQAGASIEDKDYVVYESSINSYQTDIYTIGITAGATDVITVRSNNGTTAFNLFGSENS